MKEFCKDSHAFLRLQFDFTQLFLRGLLVFLCLQEYFLSQKHFYTDDDAIVLRTDAVNSTKE